MNDDLVDVKTDEGKVSIKNISLEAGCQPGKGGPQWDGVKKEVAHLDSVLTAMQGWEAVTVPQEALEESRGVWLKFRELINEDKYGQALDLYFGESADGEKNAGAFWVVLKYSDHRYRFFSEVLRPLMEEFMERDTALERYVDILQLEKVMEDATIALAEEKKGYIPEVYPDVVVDLGFSLASLGRWKEALDLTDDLTDVLYRMYGNALLANFNGTKYVSNLLLHSGHAELALARWNEFVAFLEEYPDDYEAEELAGCLTAIERERNAILAY